jgi:uncharacterized membrane protein
MRSRWFGIILAILLAGVSAWAYPQLPVRVATHWNAAGQPNGYSTRAFAVAFIPGLMVLMTLLFQILPLVDPKRSNYAKFLGSYWVIANAVLLFLGAVHVLVLAHGLGYGVSIARIIPLFMGVMFLALGNVLPRIEPNWFVGIRTPWTLSSDTVWRKTHRTGGWLFFLGGCVLMIEALLPITWWPLYALTIVPVVLVPIIQSYILWKREQHVQV